MRLYVFIESGTISSWATSSGGNNSGLAKEARRFLRSSALMCALWVRSEMEEIGFEEKSGETLLRALACAMEVMLDVIAIEGVGARVG
mmetsp:Transcript_15526/g.32003  ORF Transcript_15526/g.32003 Transcript_15526/m.32003 type:complete len:88 (+) Transcript_15526:1266-1529(+)